MNSSNLDRLYIQWLKNDTTNTAYKTKLRKKVEEMKINHDDNIDEFWNKCTAVFKKTVRETIGIQRYQIKPWITKDTWDKIEQRKK